MRIDQQQSAAGWPAGHGRQELELSTSSDCQSDNCPDTRWAVEVWCPSPHLRAPHGHMNVWSVTTRQTATCLHRPPDTTPGPATPGLTMGPHFGAIMVRYLSSTYYALATLGPLDSDGLLGPCSGSHGQHFHVAKLCWKS